MSGKRYLPVKCFANHGDAWRQLKNDIKSNRKWPPLYKSSNMHHNKNKSAAIIRMAAADMQLKKEGVL